MYGKFNEIRGLYKLNNDLTNLNPKKNLDPKKFDTIQDYVTKTNEVRAQLKDCGIDKKDVLLVYLKRFLMSIQILFLVSKFISWL